LLKPRLSATQQRYPLCALASDQELKRFPNECCFFFDAGESLGLCHKLVVQGNCRAHENFPNLEKYQIASNDAQINA
jgi:hypothetical protein